MKLEVLDPTHESGAIAFAHAPRLPALQGATVGIISNGKRNTVPFFDAYEKEPISLSLMRLSTGMLLSLVSVIEAVARRAVCMTQ